MGAHVGAKTGTADAAHYAAGAQTNQRLSACTCT
jgi:hypothetical protein